MTDDTISRQATINALNKTCDRICVYSKKQRWTMCGACPLGCAFEVIDVLPTAEPQIIKCKECKYSIDFYGEDDCYCHRPNRELEWIGDWDFYCKAAEREQDV